MTRAAIAATAVDVAPRPPKSADEKKAFTLAVRFDVGEVSRLDRIGEALSARTPGLELSRSDAVRAAVRMGLDALELELGLAKPKSKKSR